MIVEISRGLSPPLRLEASQIIVRDQFNQPTVFVLEDVPGQQIIHSAAHETSMEFNRALEDAGIRSSIHVENVKVPHPLIIPDA